MTCILSTRALAVTGSLLRDGPVRRMTHSHRDTVTGTVARRRVSSPLIVVVIAALCLGFRMRRTGPKRP